MAVMKMVTAVIFLGINTVINAAPMVVDHTRHIANPWLHGLQQTQSVECSRDMLAVVSPTISYKHPVLTL